MWNMTRAMGPRASWHRPVTGDRRLAVERLENRRLMAAGYGLLFGTVTNDPTGGGVFPTVGPGQPNVPVVLYRNGVTTPLATTTTDATGRYSFAVNVAGEYTIVEVPPAGSQFADSRVLSQAFPASGAHANAIHVTVPDLNSVYLTSHGVSAASSVSMTVSVGGKLVDNGVGPYTESLGSTLNGTDLNASFQTFCVNDTTSLSFGGGESFRVVPKALTDLTGLNGQTIPADRAGRIAYLVDKYAGQSLTDVQGAGVQLAIWELIYNTGSTADFSQGDFHVVGPYPGTSPDKVSAAEALGASYFNESAGHDDRAILLDALGVNGTATVGFQSMVAQEHFDFVNKPTPGISSLSGYVYCDPDHNGIKEPVEPGIGGVTVTLTGTDASGRAVNRVVTTSALLDAAGHGVGYYQFDNLAAGTYTITEGVAAGFIHVNQTQGTPGNGVATTRQFVNIHLAVGVNGHDNDFGEEKPPIDFAAVLSGIHQQPSIITLTLSAAADAAQARNPANYSITGLAGPNRGGVGVQSVDYDAATRRVTLHLDHHINIHYHYEVTARVVGDSCTPVSFNSKIIGGYYHQVMIDVPAAPIVAWAHAVAPPSYQPFLLAAYHPLTTSWPYRW